MRKLGVLMVLGVLGGCGGADGGSDTAPWIGNWNVTGTQSTTCGAVSGTTQISSLNVITPGPKSGTISTTTAGCTLTWDVVSARATLENGQTCTVRVNGINVTVMWTQSSATLAAGVITGTNTGSANNGCSFMQQYTLTKM